MKKYIPVWVAAALMSFSASAQEIDEEINVVIFAPKGESPVLSDKLPQCGNVEMLEQVSAQIREYQAGNPAHSITGRREQALIVKNLKNFEEVSIPDFDHEANYNVGKELVMTKVNYHLEDEDMRLCKNTGSDIYLLMYPEGNGARVQIINFAPSASSGNEFSIYYENQTDDTLNQADTPIASEEENNAASQTSTEEKN